MIRREEFIRTHPDVRTGMEAYDDKGERLGVIERVDDDSITIEKGHIFHHDVSLPYDAIEDIRQDQVIIRRGEGFEEGRTESEEELERQYERDRSAREEQFEGEREVVYERETARGGLGKEQTRMREDMETREKLGMDEASMQADLREESARRDLGPEEIGKAESFEEGPRREPGLEEADIGSRPTAESGWEERESPRSEEEVRVPVREEEVEVTKKPVVKEEIRARKETRTETEPVSGEVRKEEVKVEPSENVEKK